LPYAPNGSSKRKKGGGGAEEEEDAEDAPTSDVIFAVEYIHELSILAKLSSVPPSLSQISRNLNTDTSFFFLPYASQELCSLLT
jgi:hypothetical protein